MPSSLSHAEASVRSTGRPVFTHCDAHHEDPGGAAAGGAAAVSEAHSHTKLIVIMLEIVVLTECVLTAGWRGKVCAGSRPSVCFL